MMYLGAGYMDERGQYTAHNPKVVFNEAVLPIGAACMAHCAVGGRERVITESLKSRSLSVNGILNLSKNSCFGIQSIMADEPGPTLRVAG